MQKNSLEKSPISSGNKRKKRKPKITIKDDDCPTCSTCHSKLVRVSDITNISLDTLRLAGSGSVLSCSACGSELRPLSAFYN
ncbi:Zn finger-like protein [Sea otter poxvirus]|uniref:Zn finger-like protein n=1 Tax=Sea otter poxvirus TaxID=1416741 RepID=A0A2U9QHT0_9POXV|nr:Zn finger-like protein [Sea otter poxvirus]AWU47154.1 Zn finger-like protein [Sea otter poxvirus]